VYVDIAQSSAEMLALRKALESGQIDSAAGERKVSLILDDDSAYSETGVLKFTEAFVDQATGSVTLRSLFSNPKMTLLPGMFVRAFVDEGVKENAILVPQRGVTRNPAGNAMVMLVGDGEKVEPRVITTERTVGNNWLVSSGLKPGDRVIMEGIQRARPGTEVKATPFGEAAPAAPGKH
jgi:membrane fusion protein (multidrug efflux system)